MWVIFADHEIMPLKAVHRLRYMFSLEKASVEYALVRLDEMTFTDFLVRLPILKEFVVINRFFRVKASIILENDGREYLAFICPVEIADIGHGLFFL